jgi:predicted dinucleotide-binding enzyme
MNVGVLGRGNVGRTLAAAFRDRGHEVMIGSRDPRHEDLQEWLRGEGEGVQGGTMTETAQFA